MWWHAARTPLNTKVWTQIWSQLWITTTHRCWLPRTLFLSLSLRLFFLLTVSLLQSLAICSRRKHCGVSGERGPSGPRHRGEHFQIPSHVWTTQNHLAVNTRRNSERIRDDVLRGFLQYSPPQHRPSSPSPPGHAELYVRGAHPWFAACVLVWSTSVVRDGQLCKIVHICLFTSARRRNYVNEHLNTS